MDLESAPSRLPFGGAVLKPYKGWLMDTLKRNHERQPERKVLGCVVSRIGGRSRFFWGQNMFPEDKSRRVDSTHLKNNSQIGSFSQVEVKVKKSLKPVPSHCT